MNLFCTILLIVLMVEIADVIVVELRKPVEVKCVWEFPTLDNRLN